MKEREKGRRYYYIAKCDLGYQIYRIKEEESGTTKMEWLQNNRYTTVRDFAKVFYNLSDVTSAFTLARTRGEKRTSTTSIKKSEFEGGKEKRSWDES